MWVFTRKVEYKKNEYKVEWQSHDGMSWLTCDPLCSVTPCNISVRIFYYFTFFSGIPGGRSNTTHPKAILNKILNNEKHVILLDLNMEIGII